MVYHFSMDIVKSIILGIIEGATEFLPISSTGHLLISEKLLNFKDTTALYTVVIQLGAIFAAVWYFRKDLVSITKGLLSREKVMTTFCMHVVIGIIPVALLGLIIEKTIGLPDSPTLIAASLILGGVVFLLVENQPHKPADPKGKVVYGDITAKRSLLIGIGQCLALIPGVSRSGATIMTGLLAGLDRKTATVFSFYLSIPIMIAASALKLYSDSSALSEISGGSASLFFGVISAFISALLVIHWLLGYVQKHNFKPFAYYRIGLGTLLFVLISYNVI